MTRAYSKTFIGLNLITVRDGNDVEPEAIDIRAIEPVRSQENVEENENEKEIIENINGEEEEETRIVRLRFDKILQTLKVSTKENIEERERLMKQKKRISKSQDLQSKQNIGETPWQH